MDPILFRVLPILKHNYTDCSKKAYGREVYSLLGLKSFRARKSLATDFGAERQKFVTKSIHMGMATASDTCKYFCHF